jgi:hypothetical protein
VGARQLSLPHAVTFAAHPTGFSRPFQILGAVFYVLFMGKLI